MQIQRSKENITELSLYFHLNRNTVRKWKYRDNSDASTMGSKNPHSTVLTIKEEQMILRFRKSTLLPLDECLYARVKIIPKLTRSSLYRCLKRHSVNRLQSLDDEQDNPEKKVFKKYYSGYFHIDITEIATQEGKSQLFVAIDRSTKRTYAQSYNNKENPLPKSFYLNS